MKRLPTTFQSYIVEMLRSNTEKLKLCKNVTMIGNNNYVNIDQRRCIAHV